MLFLDRQARPPFKKTAFVGLQFSDFSLTVLFAYDKGVKKYQKLEIFMSRVLPECKLTVIATNR